MERVCQFAQENGYLYKLPDGLEQERRDAVLRELDANPDLRGSDDVKPDRDAHLYSPAFAQWLYDYDIIADVMYDMRFCGPISYLKLTSQQTRLFLQKHLNIV